jgi:multimeric flavodoxin WrbA
VAETLDESILAKMHAPDKPDVPIITANQLTEPEGLIFGFPTRYGMMCAQMKAFFDSTGSLWQQGAASTRYAAAQTAMLGRSALRWSASICSLSLRSSAGSVVISGSTSSDVMRACGHHHQHLTRVQASSPACRSRSSCPPARRAAARRLRS